MQFFCDHISSQIIFPGAGYVEMGLAAGSLMRSRVIAVALVDVKFVKPYHVVAGKN